jgi:hypothetical protein
MRWVVSVTPRPRFSPGERTPGTHYTGGWVCPRAGLDTEVSGKSPFASAGIEPRSPGRPTRSQTLYWLRYPARLQFVLLKKILSEFPSTGDVRRYNILLKCVRFQAITAPNVKMRVFWDIVLCSLGDSPPPPIITLMMEAVRTSETSVFSETTRRCIPEDSRVIKVCFDALSFAS